MQFDDPDLKDETKFNVTYVGTIRPVNNVGNLLDVAKILATKCGYDDVQFLIYGDGVELSAICNAEELTVSITDYWGDMDVPILGPWHTQMYSDSVAVSGSETLNIDISSYASGIYYIYILVDDEWYEGEFVKNSKSIEKTRNHSLQNQK